MPIVINDQTYCRAAEVFRMIGISRNTLFRWLKEGVFYDVEYRGSRGLEIIHPGSVGDR
jgi:hypothetical protein